MKAVVAAFNQEKALVGAFSVITNLQMELFQALIYFMFVAADQQDQEDWWHSLKEKETKEPKHTKGTQKAAEAKNLQCHTCTNETWTWVDIYLFNATAYNCRVEF